MKECRRSSSYGFASMRIQQFTILALWFTTFQVTHSLLVPKSLAPDESFNKSLDARSIDILAASSLSKRQLTWTDAVAKGTRLLCRLENPALLNDQSTVTASDMLARSGWVRVFQSVDSDIFSTLNSYFAQEGIANNANSRKDCKGIRWEQREDSRNSQGQDVPATWGRFVNYYNAKAGFLIAYNNFGPAYKVRNKPIKTLPDIRAWSDVTFIEWRRQTRSSGQDIKGLKYVIRYEIANKETAAIIKQAIGERAPPIYWPGLTIPMSDERARAILGTPNGVGVAYLLATHKAQFGDKTIESVQVWWRTNLWMDYIYAAFKIGPMASPSGLSAGP